MRRTCLKLTGLALVVAIVICVMPFSTFAEKSGSSMLPQEANISPEEWEVLRLTNRERYLQGIEPLTAFSTLQTAAHLRAEELPLEFSHDRPDGSDCWSVLDEVGLGVYRTVGENIAAGYQNAAQAVNGWMNSPGHRANILNEDFKHIGIGMEIFQDSYGRYWEQLFFTSFDCNYTSLELILPGSMSFDTGTGIDEMGIIGVLDCESCGKCYLPISAEYCTGYDQTVAGEQRVTARCFGLAVEFTVTVGGGAVLPGDIDDSGNVGVDDALPVMRHALGLLQLTPQQIEIADMDNDGRLSVVDGLIIMRIALEIV